MESRKSIGRLFAKKERAKSGARQAVVATVRKIAAIYYKMVTEKVNFNPEEIKKSVNANLEKKALYLSKQLKEINSLISVKEINKKVVI